eukprot:scaffold3068_cov401-Prasinococcus_capsulatus_cf.AAC.34
MCESIARVPGKGGPRPVQLTARWGTHSQRLSLRTGHVHADGARSRPGGRAGAMVATRSCPSAREHLPVWRGKRAGAALLYEVKSSEWVLRWWCALAAVQS